MILSLSAERHEKLPENIEVSSIKQEGNFLYREKDLAKTGTSASILTGGRYTRPKFSPKEFFTDTGYETKIWNGDILMDGERTYFSCGVRISSDEDRTHFIPEVLFEENSILFPNSFSKLPDERLPYMIAKIHDAEGRLYKVFAAEREKSVSESTKHMVLSDRQEFLVFFENRLEASFSAKQYRIYSDESEENVELLKKYVAVLNCIFFGVRKNEKPSFLF